VNEERSVYELLNNRGERVGTAYVEYAGPLSRWCWFAYLKGDTASNACLETGKQAFEQLEYVMKRYGLSVRPERISSAPQLITQAAPPDTAAHTDDDAGAATPTVAGTSAVVDEKLHTIEDVETTSPHHGPLSKSQADTK
jgi:hypothetical protein